MGADYGIHEKNITNFYGLVSDRIFCDRSLSLGTVPADPISPADKFCRPNGRCIPVIFEGQTLFAINSRVGALSPDYTHRNLT
jgi:hypothetical protein